MGSVGVGGERSASDPVFHPRGRQGGVRGLFVGLSTSTVFPDLFTRDGNPGCPDTPTLTPSDTPSPHSETRPRLPTTPGSPRMTLSTGSEDPGSLLGPGTGAPSHFSGPCLPNRLTGVVPDPKGVSRTEIRQALSSCPDRLEPWELEVTRMD